MKKENPNFIRFIKPVMPEPGDWTPYLKESYNSGYFANFGPAVRDFEKRLREKYARQRAVVTSPNATIGLVTALQTLGVRGKVLTPAYTFPATAQAILMAECRPVFCDVAEESWELDPATVEQALKQHPDISAILHVRAYGFGHDLSQLEAISHARGIPLIVDAAAAIGSTASISGHVGQQGNVEIFSFHATKVFGIGEGAALFIPPEMDLTCRTISNFGIRYPDVVDRGQNSKMSDFQAAVGLAVLDRIDGYIAQRQRIVQHYHAVLSQLAGIRLAPDPNLAPWQCYPVLLTKDKDVAAIIAHTLAYGLELKRGYYKPLHQTSYYSRYTDGDLPVSEDISAHVICLPVYSDMSLQTADRVLEYFSQALNP